MNNDVDFEKEFSSDEEVEQAIDSIVVTVGKRIEEGESKTAILNPIKLKQIEFTYKAVKRMVRGSGAKVTYTLHEPYKSVGYVSVVGKNIVFKNPSWLTKIAEYASNVEVYPRTDGVTQINFTFHGLTKPIE